MRVNVMAYDDGSGLSEFAGWFELNSAECFEEGTHWDGHNIVGDESGISRGVGYSELVRTAGGRWVLHTDRRNYFNGHDQWMFITPDAARDWLIRGGGWDDVVERYFGEIEEERGPGRPVVGAASSLRLGDDLTAALDTEAAAKGVTRAALVRSVLAEHVG